MYTLMPTKPSGEAGKEYYFYLGSMPTHSYMKYLYKYPQREYPYRDLVETNQRYSRDEFEYELLDTGVFDDGRYFDVFVEYAKESPQDVLIRITVHNRGLEAARLWVLPTLWFRNTWSWGEGQPKPSLRAVGPGIIQATHPALGDYWLHCEEAPELLFTENESNVSRLWSQLNATPYVKDAFTRTCSRAIARRSTLPRSGPKRRPTMSSTFPAAAARPSACVWRPPG